MMDIPTFDVDNFDEKLLPDVGKEYRLAGIGGRFRLESVLLSFDGKRHSFNVEFFRLVDRSVVRPLTVTFIGEFSPP
jgi:hypothetical protein